MNGSYDCVTQMINNLDWPLLKDRRLAARLSVLYKIHCNFTAYRELAGYLRPAHYIGRHDHSCKIAEIKVGSDKEKFAFLPRTIADWNNLPSTFFDPLPVNCKEFNKRLSDILMAIN